MGCGRESPQFKKKRQKNLHGTCKRKSPHKIKANKGCVRETPQMKIKPTRDV